MKRCKTCKYWSIDFLSVCAFAEDFSAPKAEEVFTIHVHADDDQGLEAHVYTGPEFGCIHHKEK